MSRDTQHLIALATTLLYLLIGFPDSAQAAVAIWTGGSGDWSVDTNWNPNTVPNNGVNTFNVLIDDGDVGANSRVFLDIDASVDNVTVDLSDRLILNDGRTLTIDASGLGGTIANSGLIDLTSTGTATMMQVSGGDVTLTGGGFVTLANAGNDKIVGTAGTNRLINEDNTIQGQGLVGAGTMGITNRGLIDANLNGGLLQVAVSATGGVNKGTMQASTGGSMEVSGTWGNSGGFIQALTDSEVRLRNATISGGTLATQGNGAIVSISATLEDLTIAGSFLGRGQSITGLKGTINNTGDLALAGDELETFATHLSVSGDVTLTGGGTVSLSDTENQIIGGGPTSQLINQGNTIQGAGTIRATLNNKSMVDANLTGQRLKVEPEFGTVTNTATMQASEGGILEFRTGTFTNTGGTLLARDNSTVELAGFSTIIGGTLDSEGTGAIVSIAATLEDLTIAGSFLGRGQSITGLKGTINNTGDLALAGDELETSATHLSVSGDVTLTGGGTVSLSDTENQIIGGGPTSQLINQGNTIQGTGTIRATLNNQSMVDANLTGQRLKVEPEFGTVTNTATMQASEGGTLDTEGTGAIVSISAILRDLTNAGNLLGREGGETVLEGTINNTGDIGMTSNPNSPVTRLSLIGDVTLTGGGTVSLADTQDQRIDGGENDQLINQGNTIQGAGDIRATLNNQSMVDANIAGQRLKVDPDFGTGTNTGTMRASNGGILELASGVFNTPVTIEAGGAIVDIQNTATVVQHSGSTLTEGTWRVIDTGEGAAINLDDDSTNITTIGADASVLMSGPNASFDRINNLDAVEGSFSILKGRDFNTAGDLANSGTTSVGPGSQLFVNGVYTQTGSETILNGGSLISTGGYNILAGSFTGSGSIRGDATFRASSVIAPGFSPGILNFADDFITDGFLDLELGGLLVDGLAPNINLLNVGTNPLSTEFDQINVFAQASIFDGVTVQVSLIDGFDPLAGHFFDVFTADNLVTDLDLLDFVFPILGGGLTFDPSLVSFGGRDALRLTVEPSVGQPVPEPSTYLLLITGFVLILVLGRLRRSV